MTRKCFGRKGASFLTVVLFGVILLTLAFPHGASAQFGGFDPAGQIASMYSSNNWLGQAQQWGKQIYLLLIVFELIALTISTLLFRENVGEFLGSVGLKILIGSVFFWFIANAGVAGLPGKVVQTFSHFGHQLGGNDDPTLLAAEGLTAATAYFDAGVIAKDADAAKAIAIEPTVPPGNCVSALGNGFCFRQPSEAASHTHDFFELVVNALALMVAMAIAAIYLQFALITIETYLVMGAGTLFIGFAGSRFTMPFSQGYFSYMINVGVKLFVLYLVLGMQAPLLQNVLLSSAATLALAASTPDLTGALYPIALATAAYGALSVVIGAALVTMIPGFAASFLTGQSTASGSSALQQTMSAVSATQQMMAQFSSVAHQRELAAADRTSAGQIGGGHGASAPSAAAPAAQPAGQMSPANTASENFFAAPAAAGATNNGATADPMRMNAPATATPGNGAPNVAAMQNSGATADPMRMSAGSSGAPSGIAASADGSRVVLAQNNGATADPMRMSASQSRPAAAAPPSVAAQAPPGFTGAQGQNLDPGSSAFGERGNGGKSLNDYTPQQLKTMSGAELRQAAQNTDARDVRAEALQALAANPNASDVRNVFERRAEERETAAALSEGFGLSALAQAVPRDVGQPTAVQVRIGNPDKV